MPTTRPGFIWSGTEWVAIGQEAAVAPVSYQATEPTSPATGDIWIDSDDEVPGITSSLNYRWRRIATGGETSLSGNDASGLPLAYNPGYEQVYLNGVLLYRGSDYVATTGNTITGLTALVANDTIEVLSFVTAPIGDTYTQAAADAKFASAVNNGMFLVKPTSVTGGTLGANGAITVGSAVTSVVVNGAFSAAYDNYEILWTGGVMASSSGDSQLNLFLTGSNVGYNNILRYSNGTSALSAAQSNGTQWNWIGGGSTGSGLMQVKLFAPFLSVHTRMSSSAYNAWNNTAFGNCDGVHTVASSFTGFTVNVTGTGSMTGGTMRIYGYNNGA
jgi:hypothetical protein